MKMRTICAVQIIFLCLSVSFGMERENFVPLWYICLPSFLAQAALLYYSFFKFSTWRYVCLGLMAVSLLCSFFLFFLCFVRFWRFVFFPIKEDFMFALECLARIPIQGIQLVALGLQFTEIRNLPQAVRSIKTLYVDAMFFFFVQDFVYSVFLSFLSEGAIYTFMGVSHFAVHVAQFSLQHPDKPKLVIFTLLWLGLIGQHTLTLIWFYDNEYIVGFNSAYLLILVIYLTNAYLLFKELDDFS